MSSSRIVQRLSQTRLGQGVWRNFRQTLHINLKNDPHIKKSQHFRLESVFLDSDILDRHRRIQVSSRQAWKAVGRCLHNQCGTASVAGLWSRTHSCHPRRWTRVRRWRSGRPGVGISPSPRSAICDAISNDPIHSDSLRNNASLMGPARSAPSSSAPAPSGAAPPESPSRPDAPCAPPHHRHCLAVRQRRQRQLQRQRAWGTSRSCRLIRGQTAERGGEECRTGAWTSEGAMGGMNRLMGGSGGGEGMRGVRVWVSMMQGLLV